MTELSADQIKAQMTDRIMTGKSFTFQSLHGQYTEKSAYRIADRLIQKMRRDGLIVFNREGRQAVWFLK